MEEQVTKLKVVLNPLDQIQFRKTVRQHIKEFGCVLAILCLLVSAGQIRHHNLENASIAGALGLLFAGLGYFAPAILKPLWQGFMKVGMLLGLVMSFVVVAIAWTLVMIPMAFMLRLFGKRLMDMTFGQTKASYWEVRDSRHDDFKLLERQF